MRNKGISMPSMQGAKGVGTNSVGVSEVNGMQVVNTFKGGQFIIEDKRKKKTKTKKTVDAEANKKVVFEDMVEGTQDIPSWAIVPDANTFEDDI
mmetsp:Transcript_22780/g.34695  ORF Transcript_22780/g.34695 Transcript_22780/m.34695 type:complete len:94 (+) Transcript_22780:2-283(+)